MANIGTEMLAYEQAVAAGPGTRAISVPGVVAATVWTVGLIVGLVALAAGWDLLAGIALTPAIMSPWFGLAWAARAERRVANARMAGVTPR